MFDVLIALHEAAIDRGDYAAAVYYETRMTSQEWLIGVVTNSR